VLREGHIAGELQRHQFSEERITDYLILQGVPVS
jgi:hypothetical protein